MFPVDLFIPSRGGVIGRGGSAGFERHRTNDIVGPWVRLPRMGDGPMPGPWGGEGGPWGAEAESSPSPPHSRMSTPRMTTEASSMNGPPSPLRPTPTNKDVCKSAKVVSNMTIRAVLRSVVTKTDPQAATKRGARRSSLVDDVDKRTSAHVRCRDAVRTRGLSPSSSLQPLPRGSPRPTNGSAKAQLSTCIADANRARLDGIHQHSQREKVVTTKKKPIAATRSSVLGPWHPPQLQTVRPIGPARSATRRSQPSAEPREWVTASRPRHGSRHLKHAPAKTGPLFPFFSFCHLSPLGSCLCHSGPGRPRRLAAVRSARDHLLAGVLFLDTFVASQEAARAWGLVKPGKKASPRWTCPEYPQDQNILVTADDQNILVIAQYPSQPSVSQPPPFPAPKSHRNHADPVFNDMDNATAGRPCGRDPTNMMQSTRRRRRAGAAPVRGTGGKEKKTGHGYRLDLLVLRLFFSKPCGIRDTPDQTTFIFLFGGGREKKVFSPVLRIGS